METQHPNFDLLIERTDEGLFSIVQDSPAGSAAAVVHSPFTYEELQALWLTLQEPHQNESIRMEQQRTASRTYGEQLFRAFCTGEVADCLRNSLNIALRDRTPLRIRLMVKNAPELVHLPWEYLYNPETHEFLALSGQSTLVRYIDLRHQIRPYVVEQPLRVLVMIASPENHPQLHLEREWLGLLDTLDHLALQGKLIVELLRDPTLVGLQRQLREKKYHIFHFVGFGAFDQGSFNTVSQDGLLLFEDKMGRGRYVSGQHVGNLLRDHYSVRLAVLNLRQHRNDPARNPFINAAQSILQRGVPAAVTFSAESSPISAVNFIDEFYAAIANYENVDSAITLARRSVQNIEASAAWGSPIYFTRTARGKIFHDPAAGPLPAFDEPLTGPVDDLRLRYMI
ncbi:MAG: CHAT domain-containing protein [Caldilineaceae bacterium]|nr:CHAT domain-containing protein [Caldilineaceae bacterium]